MALTTQEQQELDQLESELAGSVMLENRQQPGLLSQLGQATVESLPSIGGMIGGVVGALGTRTPAGARAGFGLGAAGVRSMLGAGLGGATGEAAQQAITGRPSPLAVLRGGIEQAVYDAAGNLIFSAAGKTYRIAKDQLGKYFPGQAPEEATVAAQKLLQSEGATLTPFQATEDPWAGFKESVARGSFTGKPVFEAAEKKTDQAITSAKNKILDEVSTRVYDSLQTGKEFVTAINEGDDALKSLTRPFYEALQASPRIARQPVDIAGLKKDAQSLLARGQETAGLTLSPKERGYLESFSSLPDKIDFVTAHDISSSLKTTLRDLRRNQTEPDSKTVAQLTRIVSNIEKSMDVAGSKFAGTAIPFQGRIPDDTTTTLADQYKFYSKFYRQGIQDLYNDTAAKLLDVDPEFVGKNIFKSGNVTAWNETTTALSRAKQLRPDLNVQQTIESVRRGYLEDLLKSDGSFAKLGDKIKNDEAVRRTFEAVLPKEQQKRVLTLLEAAKLTETKPSASAPLFFAAQQAQATGALLSLGSLLVSDEARNLAVDNPVKTALVGGTIILGPRFWAKAALNPEATNSALSLIKAQDSGLPISKNLFLKASQAFEKAGITSEDLTQPMVTPTAPTGGGAGLTTAEQEELKRLEQELGQ